jgi:NAD(P)H-dependent flavin oxidoreductase YrpB (nitropropane dioxygenase family)
MTERYTIGRRDKMNAWPDRRILDLFGIESPIILAPMAGPGTAALAIAVSEAGIVLGWCGRGAIYAADDLRQAWKSFKRTRPFW